MKVALFLNGEFEQSDHLIKQIDQADTIVAVDGGLQHVLDAGYSPHIIIGDMDSLNLKDLEYHEQAGVDILRYPVQKDETDLELAVEHVLKLGFKDVLILGATGGRIDHFLGNILFFSDPKFLGNNIQILTINSEVFYCKPRQELTGEPGDGVSLIPISEVVSKVKTTGLMYPLEKEDLLRWKSRGLSNKMLHQKALIEFDSGTLLCVHRFNSQYDNKGEEK